MIDYKNVLDKIIDSTNGDELVPLVRCEALPFDYCQTILAKKKIGWRTKVQIAKRKDCPKDVLIKLIKRNGERFLRTYLYDDFYSVGVFASSKASYMLDDEIANVILQKPFGVRMLCWHTRLSETVLRTMSDMIVMEWENHSATRNISDFLYYQHRIPDDCVDKLFNLAQSIDDENAWVSKDSIIENLNLMKELPEDVFVKYIESYCEKGTMYDKKYDITKTQLFKIAANPSITKYAEMLLRMKFSNDIQIMDVLDRYENERIKYRENHKQ